MHPLQQNTQTSQAHAKTPAAPPTPNFKTAGIRLYYMRPCERIGLWATEPHAPPSRTAPSSVIVVRRTAERERDLWSCHTGLQGFFFQLSTQQQQILRSAKLKNYTVSSFNRYFYGQQEMKKEIHFQKRKKLRYFIRSSKHLFYQANVKI